MAIWERKSIGNNYCFCCENKRYCGLRALESQLNKKGTISFLWKGDGCHILQVPFTGDLEHNRLNVLMVEKYGLKAFSSNCKGRTAKKH
jgi:hypothetical protein